MNNRSFFLQNVMTAMNVVGASQGVKIGRGGYGDFRIGKEERRINYYEVVHSIEATKMPHTPCQQKTILICFPFSLLPHFYSSFFFCNSTAGAGAGGWRFAPLDLVYTADNCRNFSAAGDCY